MSFWWNVVGSLVAAGYVIIALEIWKRTRKIKTATVSDDGRRITIPYFHRGGKHQITLPYSTHRNAAVSYYEEPTHLVALVLSDETTVDVTQAHVPYLATAEQMGGSHYAVFDQLDESWTICDGLPEFD